MKGKPPPILLLWLFLGVVVVACLGWLLVGDRVLLPSIYLRYVSPWAAGSGPNPPPWNSLLWDGIAQYFPWRSYAAENLRAGILPLWNPHQFCGAPFLANGQSALLYPLNLPFWLLPPERAFGVVALIHLLLAGLFTYLFLTRLKLPRAAALFGAVGFALNGFFATWIHLPTSVDAAIWLPFLLWCIESARESRRPLLWLALAALGLACSFFAGHIQTSFYVLFAFTCYGIARSFTPLRKPVGGQPSAANGSSPVLQLAWLGGCLLLGILLVASQLLPSAELASLSHRMGQKSVVTYRTYVSFALPVPQLSLLLLPFSWGDPSQGTYFGKGTLSEFCPYMGFLTLLLAFCSSPRSHRFLWWSSLAFCLFSLLAALGGWNNALFFFLVPGFERTGGPARILLLWHFFANVLAALGFAHLLSLWRDHPSQAQRRLLFALLGVLVLLSVTLWVYRQNFLGQPGPPPNPFLLDPRSLYLIMAGVLLCAVLALLAGRIKSAFLPPVLVIFLVADLCSFWARTLIFSPANSVYPRTALTALLQGEPGRIMAISESWSLTRPPKAVLPPNSAMAIGLLDVQGYDSLFPGEYKRVLANLLEEDPSPEVNGNMILLRKFSLPLAVLLGARHVASLEPITSPALSLIGRIDGVYLYECPSALPRAYLADTVLRVPNEKIALQRLIANWQSAPPGTRPLAIITQWAGVSPHPPRFAPYLPALSVQSISANHIRLSSKSPSPSFEILRDSRYPGWRAYLNSHITYLLQADVLFRATRLPQGSHQVDYVFEPSSFKVGFFFTLVSITTVTFLLGFCFGRGRKGRKDGSELEASKDGHPRQGPDGP